MKVSLGGLILDESAVEVPIFLVTLTGFGARKGQFARIALQEFSLGDIHRVAFGEGGVVYPAVHHLRIALDDLMIDAIEHIGAHKQHCILLRF